MKWWGWLIVGHVIGFFLGHVAGYLKAERDRARKGDPTA